MPHYTESQITAANQTDLAAFLMSRGEKLKHCGHKKGGEIGLIRRRDL